MLQTRILLIEFRLPPPLIYNIGSRSQQTLYPFTVCECMVSLSTTETRGDKIFTGKDFFLQNFLTLTFDPEKLGKYFNKMNF